MVDLGSESAIAMAYAQVRAAMGIPTALFSMAVLRKTFMPSLLHVAQRTWSDDDVPLLGA